MVQFYLLRKKTLALYAKFPPTPRKRRQLKNYPDITICRGETNLIDTTCCVPKGLFSSFKRG
jgi:hypothetical protein